MRQLQSQQPKNQSLTLTPPEVFVTQNPDLPVAGWYADPSDPWRIRYWDGHAWTEHVASPQAEIDPQEQLVALIDSPLAPPLLNAEPDKYYDDFDFETVSTRTPREATIAMFFGAFFVITIVVAAVALITSR